MTPQLTDRTQLLRNRARATALFLQEMAVDEVQDRLKEVKRTFTNPLAITGFPALWPGFATTSDDELLQAPGGHDLVVHALCLHWANDPVGQLVQARRLMQPDGWLVALMFGGQTLQELRACLAQAESEVTGGLSPRVLPMAEIRDAGGLLGRAGFALPVADSFTTKVLYRDLWHLMSDLRAMGEGNALAGRLRKPTRRAVFARAAELYEAYREGDKIPATFEILTLTAWAPHESQPKPLRPGSAEARLADVLSAVEKKLPKL
jgi:SAM-dependent methyltransferase